MFYDFTATTLDGKDVSMSDYKGRVVLILNTATLWGTTTRDFTQMNELMDKYSSKGLSILGFPCNQFGHQENCSGNEIMTALKHIRPGNGFVPKIQMMSKIEVNGTAAHPLFKYLKEQLPYPSDNSTSFISNPNLIIWSPIQRSDIAWNFEKFLIGKDGTPLKRYSKSYITKDIASDIEKYLE